MPGRQAVTLIDCKERQRQSPYLSNVADAAVQRFNAEYLVFSLHLKQAEDLKFSDFEFSTTYLGDWLNPQVFAITLEDFKERFETPLLHLVQFGTSCLNSMTFLKATPPGRDEAIKVISTTSFDLIERSSEPIFQYFLFNNSDIQKQFDSFVFNWFQFHRRSQHIFRLYFDSMNIGFQFGVSRFLNLIQAIESYHAEKAETPSITSKKEVFADNKSQVLKTVNDRTLADWLKKELSFFPVLRSRLEELMGAAGDVMDPLVNDVDSFISKVIDSRNYYTHYDPKKKVKAAFGIELEALIYTLRNLLNYQILIECKLGEDVCKQLVTNSYQYKSTKKIIDENDFWKKEIA